MKKLDAYKVYLFIEGMSALLTSMIFTASSVYQVTTAGLSPLQLVLVGTVLELSVFLFEIPTGIVADVHSRRLSIQIGWFLVGLGFFIEGSFPVFWIILLAQVVWGIGWTFTSGATEAWITDEIGEAAAGKAFLRSAQIGNLTSLTGIGLGILLGNLRISLPIQIGGLMLALLALFLILVMPETGFKPTPRAERNSWQSMLHTFNEGLNAVRKRPSLVRILSIGLIYGLYSEGFDRLWTKHILEDFTLPLAGVLQPVMWVGLMRAIGLLLAVGAGELVHRRLDTGSQSAVVRALYAISALLVVGLFTFTLSPFLGVAVAAYWIISVTRNVIGPLYTAWVNQRLDSNVRATVLSMSGQVDAIGQITGGPLVGWIGSRISVQAALLTSSIILIPVLGLYARGIQHFSAADQIDPPTSVLSEEQTQSG